MQRHCRKRIGGEDCPHFDFKKKLREFLARHMYSLEDVIVGAGHFTAAFPFARPQRAADGQLGGLTCLAQD